MRPDLQYQGQQQETTLLETMPDTDISLDPNHFEGSFSGSELLDRADDSSSQRHAQRSWVFDRDGSLTNHHCTKKTGKKRAFWSTIWSEKASSQMEETVWMATDPPGPLLGSGEVSIVGTPKPAANSAQSLTGENESPAKNVAKEAAKLVIEEDESANCPLIESDKSGEKIVRSRSSSTCSSGSCSGMGIFSREHVVSRSQLLLQYVDHLESISWDDNRSSVLGIILEMITAVNHHVSCVDESISCHDHEEYANLQAEIRREKSQIKALVKELFGELPDADLSHLLLFQLDQ